MDQPIDIEFRFCNFKDTNHCINLIELINHYMTDPMGGAEPLNMQQRHNLITGLSAHPSVFVLFVLLNKEFAGLATCFVNFSTFKAKPYINLHDIVIQKAHRGKGLGKLLLEKIIEIAKERDYCKVTLEVREDNHNAKGLYKSLGFKNTEPLMHFWSKIT